MQVPQPLQVRIVSQPASAPPDWFSPGSISHEYAKLGPTVVIAVAVAVIGWLQWRVSRRQAEIAHAKFRLDMFEERYEVFLALWGFMSDSARSGKPLPEEQRQEMVDLIPRALFLFGDKVSGYIEQVRTREIALTMPGSSECLEAQKWLLSEVRKLPSLFYPYLGFGRFVDEASIPGLDGLPFRGASRRSAPDAAQFPGAGSGRVDVGPAA